jgi:tRNA threonylcarbamoyladenosine biosynthesis protein TsaB
MSILLNIDTALETAIVSISKDGEIIAHAENLAQKEHAHFLHQAIKNILVNAQVTLPQIDAIAVSAGPGSYTGLRVGMAAAKGFAYALQKPLLLIDTLEIMTVTALDVYPKNELDITTLICPMIDARRDEVFCALYNQHLEAIIAPTDLKLSSTSFQTELLSNTILFTGNGSTKWAEQCKDPHALFTPINNNAQSMNVLSFKKFQAGNFSNIAKAHPLYIKAFFNNKNQ